MPLFTDGRRIKFAKWLDEYIAGALISIVQRFGVRPQASQSPGRRILVIKFWGLGSITLCEPALRHLRKIHPRTQLDFLTLRQNEELFTLIPHVDRVHVLDFGSLWKFLCSLLRQIPRLRKQKYDLIFDAEFFANFSALLARILSPQKLVGFSRHGGRKQHLLDVAVPFDDHQHAVNNFLRLVVHGSSGVPADNQKDLRPRLTGLQKNTFVADTPYVIMNVNASPLALERRWPRENFLQLAHWLLQKFDINLILIGNSAERAYTQALVSILNEHNRVHNLAGDLNLRQLISVLTGAALVISNDSGPLHLAAALHKPVVGFYGPETPQRFGPLCQKKLVFYLSLPCSPCMSVDNAKTVNCTNQLRCMRDLHVEMVVARLQAFVEAHQLLPLRHERELFAPASSQIALV